MHTRKNITKWLLLSLLVTGMNSHAQNKVTVYKIDQLLKRIYNNSDTTYVVNFWATWCKPCVAELPEFEKLHTELKNTKVKVILVSMDFKEELDKKLKAFLEKTGYTAEVILLDEVNGNEFIDKVSESWSGAIPATPITRRNKSMFQFVEKKVTYDFLLEAIK